MSKVKVIIGARKSPLAQIQAKKAASALRVEAEFIGLVTEGDRIQDKHLRDLGGKELFVREVEQALLEGKIDLAVHSLKDLPAEQPAGVCLAAILPRGNPRDGLISAKRYKSLDDLPKGAKIGTASPRRTAQLKHYRPDIEPVLLRGNVDSRLAKIEQGVLDGAILAMAGLERLGRADVAVPLDESIMLPAAAQGAICIECRADDEKILEMCAAANDKRCEALVRAERSFSSSFGASCHVPVAALALWIGEEIELTAELLTPDGSHSFKQTIKGTDPQALGQEAAKAIKEQAGDDILARIIAL